MNKMKKFASIATAVLMTACMAAPMTMSLNASAVTTATLTTPDGIEADSISNVKAYQIFTGDYIPPTTNPSTSAIINPAELTVTGWGSGINVDAFITALKADTTFSGAFASVTVENSATSAQAVSDIIGVWPNDSVKAQAFAKLAVLNKTTTAKDGTFSGSSVTFGDDVDNIDNGYYVVTCDVTTSTANYDSMSLGMLTVIGKNAALLQVGTGTAKVGLPEVMKKVKENTKTVTGTATIGSFTEDDTANGTWNDVADYCIGDSVPFKLYGTMPEDIANYEHYYYQFTDTLGKEFNAPDFVTIKVNKTAITTAPTNSEIFTSIKKDSEGNTVITVSFEDIKEVIKQALNRDVLASDVITVEYNAVLNSNAKIGLPGQENKVDLTYSNNPNIAYKPSDNDENSDDTPGTPKNPETPGTPEVPGGTDTPETGTTPEDKVIVFTYEADFTKVDGVTGAKLEGVEFKLKNSADQYVIVDTDGKVTGWGAEAEGSTLVSGADGTFKVIGLDDGTYTLIETKPLDGYNPIGDTTVIITAGTENNQEWNNGEASSALKSFTYKIGTTGSLITGDLNDINKDCIVEAEIENKKGSSLPSTGGIGTTLFYVGGGAMVAVAGVFLITKKRMGKKED